MVTFCFTHLKKMECPYCKYSFSDEITEDQEDYLIETNLSCPECNSFVMVYHPKEK